MAAKRPPRKALTADERAKRDTLIIDLFLLGHTQQKIAQHPKVQLTSTRVNQIIAAEMERSQDDQLMRSKNAMAIHLYRHELLLREALSMAVGGDLKAMEVARRLLDSQGKLYGLADNVSRRSDVIPPMSDNEINPDDDIDELTAYRMSKPKPPEEGDKEAK